MIDNVLLTPCAAHVSYRHVCYERKGDIAVFVGYWCRDVNVYVSD